MPPKIDAHHHFWNYTPEEFDWLEGGLAKLRRDFGPHDLSPALQETGIGGVVSVQARQSLEETRFLLAQAANNPWILGVVGWVPLIDEAVEEDLAHLATNQRLRAVRHVLQGEPDERYMLRADFNRGIDLLQRYGLAYDILIFERHLPQTVEFVDRHPDQAFILDHIAKPRIKENVLEPWSSQIRELARRENVYCKVSGMVTEADFALWTPAQLRPYFDTVLEAFTPARVMFGSDWPVCLAASSYWRWHETVRSFTSALSTDEQAAIYGGTAMKAYRL